MRRMRVAIIGAGTLTEHAIMPVLSGPDSIAPPDNGAWWSRRVSAHIDIAYQAPARPEIVALCDSDASRLERVGTLARITAAARFSDWKSMLDTVPVDVLICALPPARTDALLCELGTRRFFDRAQWLWLAGPPATGSARARELAKLHANRRVWCARPSSQAAAHRAARRLVERGEIGRVRALQLRWPHALPQPQSAASGTPKTPQQRAVETSGANIAAVYAALELLMAFAVPNARRDETRRDTEITEFSNAEWAPDYARVVRRVAACEYAGATNALIEWWSGPSASVLFGAVEEWNAPLPRLEICGAQGRFLLCEGGREVRLCEPREPARVLSPPGVSPLWSAGHAAGWSEELALFAQAWAESATSRRALPAGVTLSHAANVLELWEALAQAALNDAPTLEADGISREAAVEKVEETVVPPAHKTLLPSASPTLPFG